MELTRRKRQRGGWEWLDNMKSTVTGAVNSAKGKWMPGQAQQLTNSAPIYNPPMENQGFNQVQGGSRYRRTRRNKRSRVRKWR
jgi:hypothetical protein